MDDRMITSEYESRSQEHAESPSSGVNQRLQRPSVTVVIPHHDYSEFIGDALLSVREQTYRDFRCVVVDDRSSAEHRVVLEREFARTADERFELVIAPQNMGMVHAIYRGMAQRPSSFLCVLDPDDRYKPEFLERMLAVHLNPHVYAPMVCCDQHLLKIGEGVITSTFFTDGAERLGSDWEAREEACFAKYGFHSFFPPTRPGWHWSTTSSMMFRTDALKLVAPVGPLPYSGQGDSWCANGAHMLGGSIMLREPLVYRGLHGRNDFISNVIFSMWQRREREGALELSDDVKLDVVHAFFANGSDRFFHKEAIRELLVAQFRGEQLVRLFHKVPQAAAVISGA